MEDRASDGHVTITRHRRGFDVDALKSAIAREEVNIKTFENAIERSRATITEYRGLIEEELMARAATLTIQPSSQGSPEPDDIDD